MATVQKCSTCPCAGSKRHAHPPTLARRSEPAQGQGTKKALPDWQGF